MSALRNKHEVFTRGKCVYRFFLDTIPVAWIEYKNNTLLKWSLINFVNMMDILNMTWLTLPHNDE